MYQKINNKNIKILRALHKNNLNKIIKINKIVIIWLFFFVY